MRLRENRRRAGLPLSRATPSQQPTEREAFPNTIRTSTRNSLFKSIQAWARQAGRRRALRGRADLRSSRSSVPISSRTHVAVVSTGSRSEKERKRSGSPKSGEMMT
jgi:hypothetical protein